MCLKGFALYVTGYLKQRVGLFIAVHSVDPNHIKSVVVIGDHYITV